MTRSPLRVAVALLALAGCGRRPAAPPAPAPAVPPDLDHVIVEVSDLARGAAWLRAVTGATPSPGWGTAGGSGGADFGGPGVGAVLLALGHGRYLELVGPAPDGPDSATTAAARARFAPLPVPTPIGWAVRTSDVDGVRAALAARGLRPEAPLPGARRRPDGATFRYRALQGWPYVTTLVPFFVQWEAGHGTVAPAHLAAALPPGCELTELRLDFWEPDSLQARIARAGVRVAVGYGGATQRQTIHLTMQCPSGTVELPPRAP